MSPRLFAFRASWLRARSAISARSCRRNHIEPPATALRQLKVLAEKAEVATALDTLLGIEGSAARVYFSEFAGMLKSDEDGDSRTPGRGGGVLASTSPSGTGVRRAIR